MQVIIYIICMRLKSAYAANVPTLDPGLGIYMHDIYIYAVHPVTHEIYVILDVHASWTVCIYMIYHLFPGLYMGSGWLPQVG